MFGLRFAVIHALNHGSVILSSETTKNFLVFSPKEEILHSRCSFRMTV